MNPDSLGIEIDILVSLQKILDLPEQDLQNAFNTIIPDDCAPSAMFWRLLNAKETFIGLQAALLLWIASGSRIVPHEFQQLQCSIQCCVCRN